MTPEQVERLEAAAQAADTARWVGGEMRRWPEQRPSIAMAGYTDINRVRWSPSNTSVGVCSVAAPGCERRIFLACDTEMYGGVVQICERCFHTIVWQKPRKKINPWLVAKMMERRRQEAIEKSAQWQINHALHHTTAEAYRNTRT